MKSLNIALAYYENPAMLREQQRVLLTYPPELRSKVRLIVVDDGSPREPADQAAWKADGYKLEIYRIKVDRPWGQLQARNLGMHVAPAGAWVLATDIDHILPDRCADKLLDLEVKQGHYYTFDRRMPDGAPTNPHPNSYLMNREWFWDVVGGCNEDFVGNYGTDSIFRRRAERFGRKVQLSTVHLVVYNRNGVDIGGVEGSATRAWGRKKSRWHAASNLTVKRRMKGAHLIRPTKTLAFEWERVR